MAGVLLAPVLHRLLHRFHLDVAEDSGGDSEPADDRPRCASQTQTTKGTLADNNRTETAPTDTPVPAAAAPESYPAQRLS